jgi:hypothetical protein
MHETAVASSMVEAGARGRQPRGIQGDIPDPVVTRVAAETAADVGSTLARSDLSDSQLSNFSRYSKKLPSGAQDPVITRGANGSVQFSADVPGRLPDSYATYTKVVDSGGVTTDYYKTTVAPDGSIVKVKFP